MTTKSKTFKQILEAVAATKFKLAPIEKTLEPKAEGEKEFKDAHTVDDKEHPAGSDSIVNSRKTKKDVSKEPEAIKANLTKPIAQGTSKLNKPFDYKVRQMHEVLSKDASAGDFIDDFVHSKDSKFFGDSKKQRIKRALGAYYGRNK